MNINVKESLNIDKTDVVDGNMNAGDAIFNIYLGPEVSGLSNILATISLPSQKYFKHHHHSNTIDTTDFAFVTI